MRNFVLGFIGFCFFMIIAGLLIQGAFLFKAGLAIRDNGLKTTIERVWNGPTNQIPR